MKTCLVRFSFASDTSVFPLEAIVEWSEPRSCYHAKNIRLSKSNQTTGIIPDIFIKCIKIAERPLWVHIDSHRPTSLSEALGSALEQMIPESELRIADPPVEHELTVWADSFA